jgi:Tol biopolymer transport system component
MALLIAFASYRARGDASDIYFYRHDGTGKGELVGPLPTESPRRRSDHRPSLSADGRFCAFAAQYREAAPSSLRLWDRKEGKLLTLPASNPTGADAQPSISADGRWMVFSGWERPGAVGGYDIFLFDLQRRETVPLPGLNSEYDEQMPVISGNGRWIAYASTQPEKAGDVPGNTRILLYDRDAREKVALPGLTAAGSRDTEPSLSFDGRYLAFSSDRPAPAGRPDDESGSGDIYLYDRSLARLVPLPGLNSLAHDCQPSISPGGRFLVFTSERLDGAGQRDLYLYDRRTARLLPTPGLNQEGEEFEPVLAALDPAVDRL